jgi:hypothetical protein
MSDANYTVSDIIISRQCALYELDTKMKQFFEKIKLFPRLICELKIIGNRYFIHVSKSKKIKKNGYKKNIIEPLYIICAELQFIKYKYYFVTYPIVIETKDTRQKYIRPEIKNWKICGNSYDLFLQLHDDSYYCGVIF